MNDKEIMEGILMTTKGVVDLYMHGTVESATPNVHGTFADRGWYPSEQATQQKLDTVKQRYAGIA